MDINNWMEGTCYVDIVFYDDSEDIPDEKGVPRVRRYMSRKEAIKLLGVPKATIKKALKMVD